MKFPPVRKTSLLDIRILNRVSGYPVPGKTTIYDSSQSIDPEIVPLNGGFLIKTLVLSISPFLRGLMLGPSAKTYAVSTSTSDTFSKYDIDESHLDLRSPCLSWGNRTVWNYPAHCCMLIFNRERLSGGGVGVILCSENPGVKVGDHVYGILSQSYWSSIASVTKKIIQMQISRNILS